MPVTDVVVVGAGFAGLHLLRRLRESGLTVRVLDEAGGVGGTWYWNRYPGARCDVESLSYSYSWSKELEQDWNWTERYAAQPEILAYLEHVADRFDLWRDIELGVRVESASFDETTARWLVRTDRGDDLTASFLVMATGCLSVPRIPDLPGLDEFAGEAHHTARWPHEGVDVSGRRVGVFGTGSSAIQAIPTLAESAAQVVVFQRTAAFSVPGWNRPLDPAELALLKKSYPERRAMARVTEGGNPWPGATRSVFTVSAAEREREFEDRYRIGGFILHSAFTDLFTDADANELLSDFVRDKIRGRVEDPNLAERLCPRDYPLATKRMCIDTGYFEAFNRPNVRLVDLRGAAFERVTTAGVRAGGEEFVLDVLVLATGFDAMTGALLGVDIRGRGGRSLRDAWAGGATTYLGLAVAGFPNLFTVTGPLSPSVLSNVVGSIEHHVAFIAAAIDHMRERGLTTIEATAAAQERWIAHAREVGEGTLYPRADSWYMGANVPGKPRMLLPYVGGVGTYRKECDRVVAAGYEGFKLSA